jgi:hypothetical protein
MCGPPEVIKKEFADCGINVGLCVFVKINKG